MEAMKRRTIRRGKGTSRTIRAFLYPGQFLLFRHDFNYTISWACWLRSTPIHYAQTRPQPPSCSSRADTTTPPRPCEDQLGRPGRRGLRHNCSPGSVSVDFMLYYIYIIAQLPTSYALRRHCRSRVEAPALIFIHGPHHTVFDFDKGPPNKPTADTNRTWAGSRLLCPTRHGVPFGRRKRKKKRKKKKYLGRPILLASYA